MKKDLLEALGLNKHEQQVYAAIIKYGSLSSTELGKKTNIKRTTAYSVARSLIEKGLIVEDSLQRPRTFSPAQGKDILEAIAVDKKHIEKRERAAKQLIEELAQKKAASSYPVPTIRFIEEQKITTFLKQETPKWHRALENLEKPVWWGFQDHTFAEKFSSWIDWQWKKAPNTVSLQLLSNESKVEKRLAGKYIKRHIKFLADSARFNSTIWVIEEFVVITNTRHTPFYAYEIHDALLANDLRELFKNLWDDK